MPLASVIVPTYNSASWKKGSVELVLISLFRQDLARFEVIVVDDGSDDATPALVERAATRRPPRVDLRTLRLDHTGNRARVRNVGVEHAAAETIVFIDDDTMFLSDDGLGRVVQAVGRRTFCCGATRHWSFPSWDRDRFMARLVRGQYDALAADAEVPAVRTGRGRTSLSEYTYLSNCGALRREAFAAIRGFDADGYRGWGLEDVDLMLRLLAAGARFRNLHERVHVLHLSHPSDPAGHRIRDANFQRYEERQRELGLRLDMNRLFGQVPGPPLRPVVKFLATSLRGR
jgi:glycosyltransferase involved in cell wall biosynthesis